jgi:hypothetical protein
MRTCTPGHHPILAADVEDFGRYFGFLQLAATLNETSALIFQTQLQKNTTNLV